MKKFGIEEDPTNVASKLKGNLEMFVWTFDTPVQMKEYTISTIVYVENKETLFVPFIEFGQSKMTSLQINNLFKRFTENPTSFNNQ